MEDRLVTNGRATIDRREPSADGNVARAAPIVVPERAPAGLPGRLTETGYLLPDDLTYERWVEVGQTLQQMERSIGFWLADWWAYGERRWGELSAQAIKDLTGHERTTLWNYGSVARAIEPSRRREELSFSHHVEVARVAREDPDFADELLGRAVEQKLTREELRDEVRRATRERALALPVPPDDRLLVDVQVEVGDARHLPLEDETVDVFVTSPPYGLDKPYASGDAAEGWQAFTRDWLREAYRAARQHGRLAVNVPLDTTRGGLRPIYAQLVDAAVAAGWTYRFSVVWAEDTVSKSTARGSVDSPQAIHVVAPVEMVAVFSKGDWKRDPSGRTWDLARQDWLAWTNGLWRFPGENNLWEGFPAAFPVELPHRLITLLSFHDDLVCDPFVGSGTTAVVAARLRRRFVGFDLDPAQVASTKRRLAVVGHR